MQSSGWWKYLGLTYITENVYGKVADSKPHPFFIGDEGDGFVGNNNTEQIAQLLGAAIMGLVSDDVPEENYTRTVNTLVEKFAQVHTFLTQ